VEEQPPPVQASPKHSGIGIASFVISIVAGVAILIVFAIAGILEATTPGGMDEKSAAAILTGLCIIALILVDIVALGLGLAGLFQRDRKKLFAILGTVFSFATVACTIVLIVLGLLAKQA
jgi:hypothetical protein